MTDYVKKNQRFADTYLDRQIDELVRGINAHLDSLLGHNRFGTDTDYVEIESDGTIHLVNGATVFKDVFFPMSPPKTVGAGNPTLVTWNGNLRGFAFAVNDTHDFDPQEYPHDAKENATAEWHLHFVSRTNVAAARTIKFQIEYSHEPDTGPYLAPVTAEIEYTVPANTPVNTPFRLDVSTMTMGKINRQTWVKLTRIASSGTEPAVDPVITALHYHYEVDTMGSRQITTK